MAAGATEPVGAGRLDQDGDRLTYTYGASYRGRKSAIPLYELELPLQKGIISPITGLSMGRCIRDGSPDAWGRPVIISRLTGRKPDDAGVPEAGELTFLLQSGSDRIGALEFRASATEYVSCAEIPSSPGHGISPRIAYRTGSFRDEEAFLTDR